MSVLDSQQLLMPKKVYIGDTAELRCSFTSPSGLLRNFAATGADSVRLSLAAFSEPLDSQAYSIKEITLSATGPDRYQLSVIFVPWRTGELAFPDYELSANFSQSASASALPSDFSPASDERIFLQFEPASIVSITQQDSITALRPGASPLLLPGTTYRIYSALLIFLLLLILIVRSILKHEEIGFYIRNKRLLRKYKKNRRKTEKSLSALLDSPSAGKEFAQEFQRILRNYLEVRFNQPFGKIVSSDFMRIFHAVFGGTEDFSSLMSERTENACIQMTALFTRTDFIRYSQKPLFAPQEKAQLVNSAISCIRDFEEPERSAAAAAGEGKNA